MPKVDFDTKKLAKTVGANFEGFVRKIVLDGLRQLIRQSPVDTGRFKANWSASVGSMGGYTTEDKSSTPHGKLTGSNRFSGQSQSLLKYKLNSTAFLYNNLQYATALEYGTHRSKQAPKGWVRNTANLMQSQMNKIKDIV